MRVLLNTLNVLALNIVFQTFTKTKAFSDAIKKNYNVSPLKKLND